MNNWLTNSSYVYFIGFAAQILFSARLLLQWALSEKKKKVITPELFWQLSLMGSILLFIYGWLRNDFAIMLGQSLTYFIYIRNMQLQNSWQKLPVVIRGLIYIFPLIIIYYSFHNQQIDIDRLFKNDDIPLKLLIWGSIAQVIFTLRFVYQWFYSEKIKESKLPFGFWLLSLIGAVMILTYAIFRKDPVLFIGQLFGSIIYMRNIIIGRKERR